MQKLNSKSIKNTTFGTILSAIILFGIIFRTMAWLKGYPLFYDEASLLYNINEKSTAELFLPLYEGQCCPPLFLICSKFIYRIFGANEIALRFLPWLFSVLSLIIFCKLSTKVLRNKICILAANALFATSEFIILYTMFFKHYTCDVFFSVLIVLLAFWFKDKDLKRGELVALSAFGIISILFSYTSCFIIASSFFVLFVYRVSKSISSTKESPIKTELFKSIYFIIPLLIFGIFYFSINCSYAIKSEYLQHFWGVLFGTMFPADINQARNFLTFFASSTAWELSTLLFLVISIFVTFKKDKFFFGIIFSPFIFAATAGLLHLYPFFAERVSIYLIPLFILWIIKPIDYIELKSKTLTITAITLCCLTLLNYGKIYKYFSQNSGVTTLEVIKHNYEKRYQTEKSAYAKEFIDFLRHSDYSSDDYIFCKFANHRLFELYDPKEDVNREKVFYFPSDLDEVPTGSTIFFCLSEKYDNIYPETSEWIEKHGEISYEIPSFGYKFLKVKKVR